MLCDYRDTTIIYVCTSITNAGFQSFHCLICETFFTKAPKVERHLKRCNERVKMSIPGTYQIRETLSDKLDSIANNYTSERKFLKNSAIFNSESNCVQEETFEDTSVLMEFVLIATLRTQQSAALITLILVKKYLPPSLNSVARKESSMN